MDMPLPDFQQPMRMWLDFMSKMYSAGTTMSPETFPPDAARQMRDMFLQGLSHYSEQYMRSPQFLEMMKQSSDAALGFRQQVNDFLTQAHHAVNGVARPDLDSLLMAIRRSETRILDRLDEVCRRLDAMETSAESPEGVDGKHARKAR